MNTLDMDYRFEPRDPSRRIKGLIIVIALHAIIGYALVSGMARKGIDFIKKPLEAVVIQEVIIPPPPPPPPPKKIEKPLVMPKAEAPPPPYAPPPDAPVATGPKRTTIGLACPTQVPPEMPRKALQDGIEGVVKAQIHIKNGIIQDVTVLSGPRVFHTAVKAAMMQYKCVTNESDVIAVQEFNFKLD
jgi:protein TonB